MTRTNWARRKNLLQYAFLTWSCRLDVDRHEWFLEIHDVETRALVTVLEILSPVTRSSTQCREEYILEKRWIFGSRTNLVEIDLLRAGKPMPLQRKPKHSDYRILISRGRPVPGRNLPSSTRAIDPIDSDSSLGGDGEPDLDLGTVLHALYDRARFRPAAELRETAGPAAEGEVMWTGLWRS